MILADIESLLASVLVPVVVGLLAGGPAWVAVRRARYANGLDHATVAERLTRVEERLRSIESRLLEHVSWEESQKWDTILRIIEREVEAAEGHTELR